MLCDLRSKKCWQLMGQLMGQLIVAGWLTGCSQVTSVPVSPSEENSNNPYSHFRQAVNEVEPLIDPDLEDITASQFKGEIATITAGPTTLPDTDLLSLRGDLTLATAPPLFTFNEQIYQRLIQAGYGGQLNIKTLKSETAIQQFCQGSDIDLLTVNRAMTPSEVEACQGKGRQPLALAIGKDPLLVVVNNQNEFIQGIDLKKLKAILTRKRWSEVASGWPNESIQRSMVGPNSSTVTLFTQKLFSDNAAALLNAPGTKFYDYPEPMIQSLSTVPHGVVFINASIHKQFTQTVKAIPINGISASQDTVDNNTYPLVQSLFLYVDKQQLGERILTNAVVNSYLIYLSDVIPEVGLLPLTSAQLEQTKKQWLKEIGSN